MSKGQGARSVLAGTSGSDIVLVRVTTDPVLLRPKLDVSFGVGGRAVLDTGGVAFASGVAAQADGKLIVAGRVELRWSEPQKIRASAWSAKCTEPVQIGLENQTSVHRIPANLDSSGTADLLITNITSASTTVSHGDVLPKKSKG